MLEFFIFAGSGPAFSGLPPDVVSTLKGRSGHFREWPSEQYGARWFLGGGQTDCFGRG